VSGGQRRSSATEQPGTGSRVSLEEAAAAERDHEVEQRGGPPTDEQVRQGILRATAQRLRLQRGPVLQELRIREPVLHTAFQLGECRAIFHAGQLRLVGLLARQFHVERALPLGLLDSGGERELERPRVRADLRTLLHPQPRLRLVLAASCGLQRAFLRAHVGPLLRGTLLGSLLHAQLGLLHAQLGRLQDAVRGGTILRRFPGGAATAAATHQQKALHRVGGLSGGRSAVRARQHQSCRQETTEEQRCVK